MASRKDRMTLHEIDGITVMDLGVMDIWDGADLSLLRETLTELIVDEKRPRIGVVMQHVKYIPSGFFGMLFDWHEKGTEMYLFAPQSNVAGMLWFQQFFKFVEDGRYILHEEPREEFVPVVHESWKGEAPWKEKEQSSSQPVAQTSVAHKG